MQNVMTRILEWGKALPFWEQIVLDKIIAGEQFTEKDFENILNYLLEDEGLSESVTEKITPRFYQFIDTKVDTFSTIRLKQISNLQNVNALAENQTLTFCEGLTAIYGENGSGKSGYARVLASAAFTRGDRDVLPDITCSEGVSKPLSADILISKDGVDKVINYKFNQRSADLASFYVFDSTSVRVHMNEQNPLSFSPAGLEYLKQLADITDQVRIRLTQKISECCQDCEYSNFFPGDSEVNRIMISINPDTDLVRLKSLATLSAEEKKRRSELAIQIANFELDKVREQITDLNSRIIALEDYSRTLAKEKEILSDDRLSSINKSLIDFQHFQEAASIEGVESFKSKSLKNVGSPEWQRMVESARDLAIREGGEEFPLENDVCLLCQQPLSTQAHLLLHQLWDFIRGQAKDSLRTVQRTLDLERMSLQETKTLSLVSDFPVISHLIGEGRTDLISQVKETISTYEERYEVLRKNINPGRPFEFKAISSDCLENLETFISGLRIEKERLENLNIEQEVLRLETEKRELDHRVTLGSVYENIKEYIEKNRWAREAGKVGGSTHHITSLHNALFKELVTDEYIRIFEKMLNEMGRPLKVKISTMGKKGQTLKQITLESSPNAKEFAKPEKVLSEGEKRAVALADFLTEVELDSTSNGIILDDPVTSLDLEWRETIAEMLVKKAKDLQVIIFTHDLPFLYYLKKKIEKYSLTMKTHSIKRGGPDYRPGFVYLDNSPSLEKEYRKPTKARELYLKAKDAEEINQEAILREGFGALRTTYESFIVFDMFKEVVLRFDDRISFGRLKDICWDAGIAAEVIESCEKISRFIEGHSHSDVFSGAPPKPDMLIQEIEHFEDIQKRFRQLKKNPSNLTAGSN